MPDHTVIRIESFEQRYKKFQALVESGVLKFYTEWSDDGTPGRTRCRLTYPSGTTKEMSRREAQAFLLGAQLVQSAEARKSTPTPD